MLKEVLSVSALIVVYHTLCTYGRYFFDIALYFQLRGFMFIRQMDFIFDYCGAVFALGFLV